MTVSPLVPTNSPRDIVRKMSTKSDETLDRLVVLDQYLAGEQPMSWIAPEIAASTEGRLRSLVIGWPRLVVSAVEERLDVEGFRAPGADKPDTALWDIWQAEPDPVLRTRVVW